MKGKLVWIALLLMVLMACEKSDDDAKTGPIVNTEWKLEQIIDESDIASNFPSTINDFEIAFKENGNIELVNLCNYTFGSYSLSSGNSIKIYNVGQGTEKYCEPLLRMQWETLFVNSFITAKTYSIDKKKLSINCEDCKLVFAVVEPSE